MDRLPASWANHLRKIANLRSEVPMRPVSTSRTTNRSRTTPFGNGVVIKKFAIFSGCIRSAPGFAIADMFCTVRVRILSEDDNPATKTTTFAELPRRSLFAKPGKKHQHARCKLLPSWRPRR